MDVMDTKVYEDLPDLRQLYPDISNQYATLASLKEHPKMKGKGKRKLTLDPMDVLLKQLPLSVTREQIDRLSASFCPLCPSRANCNSLAERLFDVDKLELIPLYARMVATLSKCMPAFSDALFSGLLDEILKVLPKKGKDKVERKLVVVSFIGELCLFGVASPIKVLQILQACLLDTENLLVAKLLVKICGSILLQNAETTQMMTSIIPQIEGLERNMVENKQRQQVVEAEEEREFERKNQLVRVEQEMRKEQEREERERVEEEKRLEKNRIILLKEEEKKEKDRLKKLNKERKMKEILKEEEKERERRAKEERDAKLMEERKAKEERDAEVKLIEERKAKEREEKAKRDQLVADAIERRALILKVHNAAQELDRLKEEVWKREDSIGHVGLTPEERRKEEMEEEARLDEAINGHKERIGNLRRLLCEVDYLTKKMDDERKMEDDMLVEAWKVLEKEEEKKKNREEEDEASH